MEHNLETFLRQKKEKQPIINWESKKQKWQLSVNQLYTNIEAWLSHLIKDDIVNVSYENIILDEYYISYAMRQMNISVGYESVQLEPKGMIVVNAEGRVDMIGDDGTVKLLLIEEDEYYE